MKDKNGKRLGYAASILQGKEKSQSTGLRHFSEMYLASGSGFIFSRAAMENAACRQS